MYFTQIKTPGLGCYSYVIGCPAAGVMAVVDPKRDVADYLKISREEGLRITHVIETHVHADHVSGAQELRALGAVIHIHESAGAKYEHVGLKHGQTLKLGSAKLEILHTPGHTPNSISLLVSDLLRSPEPMLILTGDLLFVGDIGRPDLPGGEILGEQVDNLYRGLYSTLAAYPDYLEVYPAHGQGSLCGKGMSSLGVSTLGYERLANPMLKFPDFESFRKSVLGEFPARPRSFSRIIQTNLQGAALLPCCPKDLPLAPDEFERQIQAGAVVIDTREASAFGGAHVPGSLNVGFESQVANWIGMSVDPDSRILLVVSAPELFPALREQLYRIGYDDIVGYLKGGITAWAASGRPLASLPQVSAKELHGLIADNPEIQVIDVRTPAEWKSGHIKGARHLPLSALLTDKQAKLPSGELYLVCHTGYRSNLAASYLQAKTQAKASSLLGGMTAWQKAGLGSVK